jgi:hypothetical protein
MTNPGAAELTASSVIERIESGLFPRETVLTIARGFLPLAQDDLIPVLAFLTASSDREIAGLARTALAEIPARSVMGFAANENVPAAHLVLLLTATADLQVLESLIRNRSVPDAAVVDLAKHHEDPAIQEVIVINQARILRAPEILDALLANPSLSIDARRRALEHREEFFEKKARQAQEELAEEAVAVDLPDYKIEDLIEKAAEEDAHGTPPAQIELSELEKNDPDKISVVKEILTMSVAQKVQLAFKGGKSARMILIRERNKLICSAVMRNPRLNDNEVESIAGMRNVDDEVLRLITMRRDWMSKYNIVLTLARNPKAPIGVVLPLINRLTLRDLKNLKDDKGVSEAARAQARKLFAQRSQKS